MSAIVPVCLTLLDRMVLSSCRGRRESDDAANGGNIGARCDQAG